MERDSIATASNWVHRPLNMNVFVLQTPKHSRTRLFSLRLKSVIRVSTALSCVEGVGSVAAGGIRSRGDSGVSVVLARDLLVHLSRKAAGGATRPFHPGRPARVAADN